jgi:quercetin dioxygenase-like cupin family protein
LKFGVQGEVRDMRAHDWLVMPADAPHHLSAVEPTRFLLTLFKRP